MKLKNIGNASLLLVLAPMKGAIAGVKEASNRPRATSWKQFILDDVRLYFAPFTGAIAGVRAELNRQHITKAK